MRRLIIILSINLFTVSANGQSTPEMVVINGGTFEMGSNTGLPNERPVHKVTVSSFKMAKNLVTFRDFEQFVAATGYKTDAEKKGSSLVYKKDSVEWYWISGVTWRDDEVGNPRTDSDWNKPVIYVSWNDANAYCRWLSDVSGQNYRLPTEAEWEFAAGNGAKHTTYSWGNNLPGKSFATGNVRDETVHPEYGGWENPKFKGYNDGYFFTSPVGCYTANEFGLYDMTGNVWEWCSDSYEEDYYSHSPEKDPHGPVIWGFRVFRGGSWHSNPSHSRITYRYSGSMDNRTPNLGFRLAASIPANQ